LNYALFLFKKLSFFIINNKKEEIMGKKCYFCCRLPDQIPGLFLDSDADISIGGDGIPLCCYCLGTGIDLFGNAKFSELIDETINLRWASQKNQIEKKEGWQDRLKKTNERIIEIAKQVNQMVDDKVEDCYGDYLVSGVNE
jgi:hypothetical protein